jgi:hypothetical protein
MSNMAAGATIGSNHNSRANDGEIRAGRGFWPGLSVTLKHSSRFASFCLIVKGDYPYELDIPFPFSLVHNNVRRDRLEVIPAYFWMYNLYALERNSWKTANRDRRRLKVQRIETDYLAPDTAEEIIAALGLMEAWTSEAQSIFGTPNLPNPPGPEAEDAELDPEYDYSALEEEALPARGLERSRRPAVILKPRRAAAAYREMLFFYGIKTVLAYLEGRPGLDLAAFAASMNQPAGTDSTGKPPGRVTDWVNLGGQIVPAFRVDDLRRDIRERKLNDWEAIHARYEEAATAYEEDRIRHAWAVLGMESVSGFIHGTPRSAPESAETPHPLAKSKAFRQALDEALRLSTWIKDQVFISRAKDFHDPFRGITYRNRKEMEEVAGRAENNSFIRLTEEKYRMFAERIGQIKAQLFTGNGQRSARNHSRKI